MLQELGWDVWQSDRCAKLRQWLSSTLVSEISANREGMSRNGAFGWSLLSHHHPLFVPRAMEPVPLQHEALLRRWPFPMRPDGFIVVLKQESDGQSRDTC
ncbi:hypothetical protein AV530_003668 [Patagioenas fasciata monilis]|uniref:Uncharacterized protein n=1 Tax=Patagioenas fasciata monilis TaxID=372326 RepID=A0A1V4KYF2_PATFA|nr:hypothetical protein AV530_003668 [Patagioenas fasciata monilis]